MSNDDITSSSGVGTGVGATRRSPRQGIGGSPVGSTLSIVLAVVAVVVGFLILRDLTGEESATVGGGGSAQQSAETTSTTIDVGVSTTIPVIETPPVAELVTEGATVVVANGNTLGGSAGRMSEALAGAGYNMGKAVNAKANVDESVVYFDPANTAAQAVAESVARSLGGISVLEVPTPAPTTSGSLDGAGVLLVLGTSQADKELSALAAGTETPVLGEAPPVAGGSVPVEETGE